MYVVIDGVYVLMCMNLCFLSAYVSMCMGFVLTFLAAFVEIGMLNLA